MSVLTTSKFTKIETPDYALMYKDNLACTFNMSEELLITLHDFACMPLGCFSFTGLYKWLNKRCMQLERGNVSEIFNRLKLQQTNQVLMQLMLDNYAQSINDCYWVTEATSVPKYEDISIYQNDLNKDVLKMFATASKGEVPSKVITPEFTLQGAMPKFVCKEGNDLFLYKIDESFDSAESENEAFCSKFLKAIEVPCVSYTIEEKYGLTCTKTKVETSLDTHWISAEVLSELGSDPETIALTNCKKEFCTMLLTDYLLGNVDRHQGNWSFLCENGNNLTGFSPLYDYNFSFKYTIGFSTDIGILNKTRLENAVFAMSIVPELLDKTEHVLHSMKDCFQKRYILSRIAEVRGSYVQR